LSRREAGYPQREDSGADTHEDLIVEFHARQNRRPECAYVPTATKNRIRMIKKRAGTE
jgi:hypothetical protein